MVCLEAEASALDGSRSIGGIEMSWTYSGDPSSSTRDKVRFLIGDTDSSDQQLLDTEVDAILSDNADDPYATAITLAEGLAAKFSRKADKSVGDLSISYSQLGKNYTDLATRLRRTASLQLATPYAGGISIADKDAVEDDDDRVRPGFKIGMHDYAPSQDELLRED